MKRFSFGQRVKVRAVGQYSNIAIFGVPGVVVRLRRADDGAWIRLDHRVDIAGVHPFPAADETRSTDVLAYPEWCVPEPSGSG
jgi:hypothetical protein